MVEVKEKALCGGQKMNQVLLIKHLVSLKKKMGKGELGDDYDERIKRINYYQAWTRERILKMTPEDVYEYISKLWAMLIWGNKQYVVDKILSENGEDNFKQQLANLLWSKDTIEKRWDSFRTEIKHMGPAMISEILCHTHPDHYMIWNRRAHIGFKYLEIAELPRYDYQVTGKVYTNLCAHAKQISKIMKDEGFNDYTLLAVDYFIWHELQVKGNLSAMFEDQEPTDTLRKDSRENSGFIHNDIRDKLAEIGTFLGFDSKTEVKVAEGSKVDATWEYRIGNLGRVIYVFEVQTRGSIDSLIMNLLKALNNPAVQGVVAVSDKEQLEKILRYSNEIAPLKGKLKILNFDDVLKIYDSMAYVNATINELGLVPEGF